MPVQFETQVDVCPRQADSSHRLIGREEIQIKRVGFLISGQERPLSVVMLPAPAVSVVLGDDRTRRSTRGQQGLQEVVQNAIHHGPTNLVAQAANRQSSLLADHLQADARSGQGRTKSVNVTDLSTAE